jgi:hypothetical protein
MTEYEEMLEWFADMYAAGVLLLKGLVPVFVGLLGVALYYWK